MMYDVTLVYETKDFFIRFYFFFVTFTSITDAFLSFKSQGMAANPLLLDRVRSHVFILTN